MTQLALIKHCLLLTNSLTSFKRYVGTPSWFKSVALTWLNGGVHLSVCAGSCYGFMALFQGLWHHTCGVLEQVESLFVFWSTGLLFNATSGSWVSTDLTKTLLIFYIGFNGYYMYISQYHLCIFISWKIPHSS